jgi:hypothetical protein
VTDHVKGATEPGERAAPTIEDAFDRLVAEGKERLSRPLSARSGRDSSSSTAEVRNSA